MSNFIFSSPQECFLLALNIVYDISNYYSLYYSKCQTRPKRTIRNRVKYRFANKNY